MLEKKFTKSMIDDDDGDDAGEQCDVRIDRFFYSFSPLRGNEGGNRVGQKNRQTWGKGGKLGL